MNVRPAFPWRAQLCPLRAGDEPVIETWFPEAAAAVWGGSPSCADSWPTFRSRWFLKEERTRRAYVLRVAPDPAPIGVIAWEYKGRGRFAVLRFLAIAPDRRGHGYGAEAVFVMEALAGAPIICLPLPPRNGRALYFWLRLGYRPLLQEEQEAFMRAEGGVWMLRAIVGTCGGYPLGGSSSVSQEMGGKVS